MNLGLPWRTAHCWPGALLVLALHLGLVALLLAVRPVLRRPGPPARAVPLLQWLWPVPPQTTVATGPRTAARQRSSQPVLAKTPPLGTVPHQPPDPPHNPQIGQGIRQPDAQSTAPPSPLTNHATPEAPAPAAAAQNPPAAWAAGLAAQPPASAPLNLARPGAAAQAPPSPAALAARAAREASVIGRDERLAQTLGTDTTLRTQTLADGTLRVRRGSSCVDLHPNRAQTLAPFNQSTHPLPRSAESCN